MELIGERGAAGVTVDEIATAAGVSKGTVYYNFGSKSDLIAQLLRHGVDILLARLLSVRDDSADPLAAMDEMIGQAMDFMDEYPSFARLWVSENWRTPSEWQDTFAELRGRLLAVVGAAIDGGGRRLPGGSGGVPGQPGDGHLRGLLRGGPGPADLQPGADPRAKCHGNHGVHARLRREVAPLGDD